MENKDYSKLTLEELQREEKELKKQEIIGAVIVGFLVGVMVFGLVRNGFGLLYTVIPIFLIYGIAKNAQQLKAKLKQVRAVMATKSME
ncbi:MAG: FUSC family protein [Bacteroidota bacterium]